jgi:hypothetical protein
LIFNSGTKNSIPYINLTQPLGNNCGGDSAILFDDHSIGLSSLDPNGLTLITDRGYSFYCTVAHELLHRNADLDDVNDIKNIMHWTDYDSPGYENLLYYHKIQGVETGTSTPNGNWNSQWNQIHGAAQ